MRTKIKLPVLLMSATILSCNKEPLDIKGETSAENDVSIEICATEELKDALYEDVKAEVKLAAYSVDTTIAKSTAIWDTTLPARSVKDFALLKKPIVITKTLPVISDNNEVVRVPATRNFNYKGATSSDTETEDVEKGGPVKVVFSE